MSTRSTCSFALLSFVATAFTFTLTHGARADMPSGSGPTTTSTTAATSTTSSSGGAGGATTTGATTGAASSGSSYDANCTINQEEVAGSTCAECPPGACTGLTKDYNFVCQRTATVQVWCNGPVRNAPSNQNAACAVRAPGGTLAGAAAAGGIALLAALFLRRRRES